MNKKLLVGCAIGILVGVIAGEERKVAILNKKCRLLEDMNTNNDLIIKMLKDVSKLKDLKIEGLEEQLNEFKREA